MLVSEKSGRVRVYRGVEDPEPTVAIDLSEQVHDFWDRGLLGMALVLTGRDGAGRRHRVTAGVPLRLS